jgi:beta-phosphoglucomutase-like phosphatase (HAD superfamily)
VRVRDLRERERERERERGEREREREKEREREGERERRGGEREGEDVTERRMPYAWTPSSRSVSGSLDAVGLAEKRQTSLCLNRIAYKTEVILIYVRK